MEENGLPAVGLMVNVPVVTIGTEPARLMVLEVKVTLAVLDGTFASPLIEPILNVPTVTGTVIASEPPSTAIAPDALSRSNVPELPPMPTCNALPVPLDKVMEIPPPPLVAVDNIRVWSSTSRPASAVTVDAVMEMAVALLVFAD